MSHSTVTVVIRDAETAEEALGQLEWLLDPFDENKEDVEPYPEWLEAQHVEMAVEYYRANPDSCTEDGDGPIAPFEEYVTEGNLEAWNEWTKMAVGGYHSNGRDRGIYDAENDRFGYLCTYNRRSRWDWWELGGRWHGFYQLKPKVSLGGVPLPQWRKKLTEGHPVGDDRVFGEETIETYDGSQDAVLGNGGVFGDPEDENFEARADLARKGDIDFEAMRAMAGTQADQIYDEFEKATVGLPLPESWQETVRRVYFDHDQDPDETYDGYVLKAQASTPDAQAVQEAIEQRSVVAPVSVEDWTDQRRGIIDEARRQYHDQVWIQALQKVNLLPFMDDPVEMWCVHTGGRETYVARARAGVAETHALLLDGEWHEQGRMGWFGTVSNEKEQSIWEREFSKLLDRLPDEVYLAVVDVHI